MRKQESISPEHKEVLQKIGLLLKNMRKKRKLNTIQLVSEIGVHRNSYSLLERGKIDFQFTTLMRVLDYYGISAAEFFQKL